jgi:hypothetical protein
VTEELDDRVRRQIRGDTGGDVQLRIYLYQVKPDDPSSFGNRDEGVAQLGVQHGGILGDNAIRRMGLTLGGDG